MCLVPLLCVIIMLCLVEQNVNECKCDVNVRRTVFRPAVSFKKAMMTQLKGGNNHGKTLNMPVL